MATPGSVLVVGSCNTDYILTGVPHLPRPGETVLADAPAAAFRTAQGGKSANAAVAAARAFLGHALGSVSLIACLGDDAQGAASLEAYEDEGIYVGLCKRTRRASSGVAVILVGADGENTIVVLPGANRELRPRDLGAETATDTAPGQEEEEEEDAVDGESRLQEIRSASVVLLQLEIRLDTVQFVAETVRQQWLSQRAPLLLLNMAPMPSAPAPDGIDSVRALLRCVNLLVLNEVECEQLCAMLLRADAAHATQVLAAATQRDEWRAVCEALMAQAPLAVAIVVTLGAHGAACLFRPAPPPTSEATPPENSAPPVWMVQSVRLPESLESVVDTTGAGDCFCGVLAAALAEALAPAHEGDTAPALTAEVFRDAMRLACCAATLSVTRSGAQPSFPKRDDIRHRQSRVAPRER
ncbi:hypothetical protein CDCA_CDCA01G0267 [Cyanidium caldarium]|uniref:Ribokinase n=1 Tax=Cyanidium caldarium TaxID=2771 RepID=A0AAV9IPQ0_CYACA|nr:hypothetical protein CDCA_CDCA01G0267 [Cyanidium caldarium]